LNFLIGVRGAAKMAGAPKVQKIFESGKCAGFSLTKKVQIFEGNAFGDILRPKLALFDNPGIGALDLCIYDIIKDLRESIDH
jgi:hypothetical protein